MDGKSRVVDASWIDADTVSLIDRGAVREIRFHDGGSNGAVVVELAGRRYQADIAKTGRAGSVVRGAGKTSAAPFSTAAHIAVKASMPGRIVKVLVAVGDRVSARQGVVVIEAMKMENELWTPRDGVVTEIAVVAGSTVDTGAVLVVVGDQEARE
jgi:biotin carboxyl carrier protein